MSIQNPNTNRGGRPHSPPILRAQIEEAPRNTNSNHAAARWLGVSYKRYRRYAQLYNLFDQHLNMAGVGVDKGWSKRPTSIPLRDVLAGKHPDYSLAKLKNRLIARKKIKEECTCCGFNEKRITDNKAPLMLTFKDGNRTNFALDNLTLYCYNCMFLTTGAPSVVNKKLIERSFRAPETIPANQNIPVVTADYYDPVDTDDLDLAGANIILSAAELQELLEHEG